MLQGPLKYPKMAAFLESVVEAMTDQAENRSAALSIEDASGSEEVFQSKCG